MIKLLVNIEGKIINFVKPYSGNIAFYVADKNNNSHYCFTIKKISLGEISDHVNIIGEKSRSDKIRIDYLENITKNQIVAITRSPSKRLNQFITNNKKLGVVQNIPQVDNNQKEPEDNRVANYCSDCGQKLSPEMKYCAYCGNEV